ncbi:hypothetical protein HUW51_15015 [Adhaeribacter swui]|uniref:Uncharacterized protein n=1 Tax=Adhaeribacter swui TaxID=2086471 RepID=A0A7G7G9Y4_9BACT|nr:hypothetical protein [Adhaeribacter swui]QNF33968.1 hypothetical protein HUW51_15015 [Adhaeribacter swui]
MRDISEFIYGDEYTQKNKAFEAAMAAIEEKHQDYFQSRPAQNETEPHDRLHNHYALSTASGQVSFRFNEGSDLPASLKQECLDAFHEIWKEWE